MSPRTKACTASLALCGLLLGAVPVRAGAATSRPEASAVAKKKKKAKKPQPAHDKCDAIGKPCKDGDDCKPDNCKPGGEAPAPQRA